MTPLPSHHVFDPPQRFLVDAVGDPGEREFYLRATDGDGDAVAVGVAKEEVAALADGLDVLLGEVRKAGQAPAGGDVVAAAAALAGPVTGPPEPAFVLDRLTLAWDGESVVVEAAATAVAEVADDLGMSDVRSPEEVADEAAVLAELDADLDDVDVPEELGDREIPIGLLRVRMTTAQAAAFTAQARRVVAAGRPPCPLCGRPDGPQGHTCPRLN